MSDQGPGGRCAHRWFVDMLANVQIVVVAIVPPGGAGRHTVGARSSGRLRWAARRPLGDLVYSFRSQGVYLREAWYSRWLYYSNLANKRQGLDQYKSPTPEGPPGAMNAPLVLINVSRASFGPGMGLCGVGFCGRRGQRAAASAGWASAAAPQMPVTRRRGFDRWPERAGGAGPPGSVRSPDTWRTGRPGGARYRAAAAP